VLLLGLSDLGHTPPPEWVGLALETAHRWVGRVAGLGAVAGGGRGCSSRETELGWLLGRGGLLTFE
jgi:hypothetical protein